MVYLMLIVVGIVSLVILPVDLLPSIEFTQLTVRVRYPNVAPEEIEKILTDPIENAVSGLPNLERMTSSSEEGVSRVRLDFSRGTSIDEAANDLRAALDRLREELPREAEPPEILKLDLDRIEVVSMAATSTRDLESLTRILEEEISRRFAQIPGVGSIELRGGVYREIRVELDSERLRAAGLTALDVWSAVSRENVALPGGNVQSGYLDLPIRGAGEYSSIGEISQTVVRTVAGRPVRVRDLGRVRDGHQDVLYLAEINGVPSVSIGVQKQSGANTVDVAARIREEVERINGERDDLHLTIFSDQSEFIRGSIDSVRNSAVWGSLLAIAILYLFLRNRASTLIISVAIPISVVASFGLLYFGGLTLNQMTFGGLALGVGMIVDNAIVVLESIVRKREEAGTPAREAASAGTREVAGAIVASTLTTCVIFVPLAFARTTSGALFQSLALVVVFSLVCSLLVALTLVPMLAARVLRSGRLPAVRPASFTARLEGWYTARLREALRHPRRLFAIAGGVLAAALLLFPLIPVELAPQTDADEIDVEIEMAEGTNIAVVRAYVDELEAKVRGMLSAKEVDYVSTEVRGGDAEVELKLAPLATRGISGQELADRIREQVASDIPGAEIRVDAQPGLWILRRVFSSGAGEDAIELELREWDLDRADRIAAGIRDRVRRVPGIADVRVSRREGRPEERLVFRRDRIGALGLSVEAVARTVQANLGGLETGRYRDRGQEHPIVVRLEPEDRLLAEDLRRVTLRTPDGGIVALSALVDRLPARSPLEIERVDGQRVTYVTASLEGGAAVGDVVEAIRAELSDYPLPAGASLLYGGEYREQQEARRDFWIVIVMALALVYMLMAGQFERFLDPLIVMTSVPMALVGVVPMLLLTGTTLNLQSVMGLVMLVGIVVNNAIVLVDAINLLRRERHMRPEEAVIEAGRLRLRPILMTTTTTVLGLLPLAIGIGAGAEIQAAFARTVIGGLIASTLVTLALIPLFYVGATAAASRTRARWRASRGARRAAVEGGAATA
jgi:HAE1 family hydrophobic/amphiphilic exporter-1